MSANGRPDSDFRYLIYEGDELVGRAMDLVGAERVLVQVGGDGLLFETVQPDGQPGPMRRGVKRGFRVVDTQPERQLNDERKE